MVEQLLWRRIDGFEALSKVGNVRSGNTDGRWKGVAGTFEARGTIECVREGFERVVPMVRWVAVVCEAREASGIGSGRSTHIYLRCGMKTMMMI